MFSLMEKKPMANWKVEKVKPKKKKRGMFWKMVGSRAK